MKRLDYKSPEFRAPEIHLQFKLGEDTSVVTLIAHVFREPGAQGAPLVLNGKNLELRSLKIDSVDVPPDQYEVNEEAETLTVRDVPDDFVLEVSNAVHPAANTTGSGLYFVKGMFSTQCEPEGFRTIVYSLDRPDVLSKITAEIIADKAKCPVVISNPNFVSLTDNGDGTHTAVWSDVFPKPTYLFALVAGDLSYIEDEYVTSPSKREVTLRIFSTREIIESGQCAHAMASLKKAMKWDEDVFGREYDLGMFQIFVSPTFNMGAMENKGLNIFNVCYVLALPETATDSEYENIIRVVGHEYFHNWSGDRVTCRDWFQISLKEGFTVYRDQEFSRSFEGLPKVIDDVWTMRTAQFAQDAGPSAHPIRLDEMVVPHNGYTLTVYEKGAEVIRMMEVILGKEEFRVGTDLFFSRHDGQAVTCEDFVKAMEDASGADLTQFREWYNWAGTPVVEVVAHYDDANKKLVLDIVQTCPPTPGQPEKPPFVIPFVVGLVGKGGDMKVSASEGNYDAETGVILITQRHETIVFENVYEEPALSLNRRFAPVKVKYDYREGEIAFLAKHDPCAFSRWDVMQTLAKSVLLKLYEDQKGGKELVLDASLVGAVGVVLADESIDLDLQDAMLTLPSEKELGNELAVEVDPVAVRLVREFAKAELARVFSSEFGELYRRNHSTDMPGSVAKRALANAALAYLAAGGFYCEASEQFLTASNMTAKLAAFVELVHGNVSGTERVLQSFYEQYEKHENVIDKWFRVQATNPNAGTLDTVKKLMEHPAFDWKIPNRVRSLVGSFAANTMQFHGISGDGYRFYTDFLLKYNAINAEVAARMVDVLIDWKRYDKSRQKLLLAELLRLDAEPTLSAGMRDKVSKALSVLCESYFA